MDYKEKIRKAVLDMMSKVEMVKIGKGHGYIGLVEPVKGKKLAGVTTITSGLSGFTTNIAANWGAKEMSIALGDYDEYEGEEPELETAKEILNEIKSIESVEEYIKYIRSAKKKHKEKSKKALDVGKKGHEIVEKYVKSRIRNEEPKLDYIGDEFIDKALKKFYEWSKDVVFYLSEARVCMIDPYETETIINGKRVKQIKHTEYAGTLDILAEVNGELAVVDIKFAERIGREFSPQTAAYAKPFSPYGIEVLNRIIIRMPKSEFTKQYNKQTRKYKRVDNEMEIEYLPKDKLEFDFNAFLNERETFRWKNAN